MIWNFILRIKTLFFLIPLIGGIWFILRPIQIDDFKKEVTTRILSQDGRLIGRTQNHNLSKQDWVPLTEYPKFVSEIVCIAEDKRFFSHHGIDPFAIINSLYSFLFSKQNRGGGSTITMQLVRMYHPNIRSYPIVFRKSFEVLEAIRFELWLNKEQILEAYLNSVSIHSNSVGFPSASLTLFEKNVRFLSIEETVYLSILIRKNIANEDEIKFRYNQLRTKIPYSLPILDSPSELVQTNLQRKIQNYDDTLNGENQHFLNWIRSLHLDPKEELVSTISSELNSEIHSIVNSELNVLKRWNVNNASAIILEKESNQTTDLSLVAMIGSKNFFEDGNGMVNGTIAFRDAGSTLKPLLYALAIDQNIYSINSILVDEKYSYSLGTGENYLPRNADLRYWGNLTLAEALANSRNIPAVTTIQLVGVPNFYRFLKLAGFENLKQSPNFYGPGLALGTGGASLLQLTRAYGTFMLGGILPKIKIGSINGKSFFYGESQRLVTEETAEEIKFILNDSKLRQKAFGKRSYLNYPFPVSVKTGTSKDYRNSWTIAFNDRYVVGAWVGNFSGEKTMDVSGSFGAGRIVQNIFRLLMKDKDKKSYTPKLTEVRSICKISGKLANSNCPSLVLNVRKKMTNLDSCEEFHDHKVSSVVGVGFVYPGQNQVFLYHPGFERDEQNIPIRIREYQTLKDPKLVWNQTLEVKLSKSGEGNVEIQRGKHSLELFDGSEKKAKVQFEVK
ncbi:transglycosylase domain-containing protein [Leptospira levettii]|uniref:peptidoglycan glycosyltransferase n=1 Tax=Leptospira levettii TaxID=2023178 RepID=A0AAW5V8U6_9LEPT|nr:transglycosylase domain-containing protein [Leptospira levettii]MCW7465886.1 transglycosylase domain-containing protein [Leptospira levettii]MCW7474726.1 transglycosylase domain-containing protein [Leptospira levettii]MCW7510624.1 transglycosylase domain-containing protein [Leptospira levettii]MCW7514377.1 transglycosylase domain-containing protein [Leptospira levettii]